MCGGEAAVVAEHNHLLIEALHARTTPRPRLAWGTHTHAKQNAVLLQPMTDPTSLSGGMTLPSWAYR